MNPEDRYITGWRDAAEFIVGVLTRTSNSPKINTTQSGQEIGKLLRETALLIDQHLTKMADTLCTPPTPPNQKSEPPSLN